MGNYVQLRMVLVTLVCVAFLGGCQCIDAESSVSNAVTVGAAPLVVSMDDLPLGGSGSGVVWTAPYERVGLFCTPKFLGHFFVDHHGQAEVRVPVKYYTSQIFEAEGKVLGSVDRECVATVASLDPIVVFYSRSARRTDNTGPSSSLAAHEDLRYGAPGVGFVESGDHRFSCVVRVSDARYYLSIDSQGEHSFGPVTDVRIGQGFVVPGTDRVLRRVTEEIMRMEVLATGSAPQIDLRGGPSTPRAR